MNLATSCSYSSLLLKWTHSQLLAFTSWYPTSCLHPIKTKRGRGSGSHSAGGSKSIHKIRLCLCGRHCLLTNDGAVASSFKLHWTAKITYISIVPTRSAANVSLSTHSHMRGGGLPRYFNSLLHQYLEAILTMLCAARHPVRPSPQFFPHIQDSEAHGILFPGVVL